MNSTFPFVKGIEEAFEENLFTITPQKERAITEVFMDWLNGSARLKPLPDLPQRIQAMEPKLRKMAKNLDLSFQDGKLVIKADAESESLLTLLRRGSDWFDPHPDVNAAILVALTNGSQLAG
jgi:hypothetical protein